MTLLQFRQEVFVVEQDCPYLDADDLDQAAWHMWSADAEGRMIAYCRILPEGIVYPGYAAIGRVISRADARRTGAGRVIMQEAISWIRQTWPDTPIKISAQSYLEDFYSSFGFQVVGEPYLEDGIPHQAMVLE